MIFYSSFLVRFKRWLGSFIRQIGKYLLGVSFWHSRRCVEARFLNRFQRSRSIRVVHDLRLAKRAFELISDDEVSSDKRISRSKNYFNLPMSTFCKLNILWSRDHIVCKLVTRVFVAFQVDISFVVETKLSFVSTPFNMLVIC